MKYSLTLKPYDNDHFIVSEILEDIDLYGGDADDACFGFVHKEISPTNEVGWRTRLLDLFPNAEARDCDEWTITFANEWEKGLIPVCMRKAELNNKYVIELPEVLEGWQFCEEVTEKILNKIGILSTCKTPRLFIGVK